MRCIYLIYFEGTNIAYIGKTNNFTTRKQGHVSLLRRNKHHNIILQHSFNKYGEDAYRMIVLQECTAEEEDYLETQFIYVYKLHRMNKVVNLTEGGKGKSQPVTDKQKHESSVRRYKGKPFVLISPDGKEYKSDDIVSLRSFSKQIGMSCGNLRALLIGKMDHAKGWTLKEKRVKPPRKEPKKRLFENAMFVSPDGIVHECIHGMSSMSLSIGKSSSNLHNVYTGKLKSYKGWTKL